MEAPFQPISPEQSVKVTYAGRAKRKRSVTSFIDQSDSESNEVATMDGISGANGSGSSKKPVSIFKLLESKGSKKIEFHLPGPSPKRVRRDSEELPDSESPPSGKVDKTLHCRTSSVNSLSHVARNGTTTSPSANKKPISLVGARIAKSQSLKRAMTPNTEIDDGASVAESSKGSAKTRRTEQERIQYFKDQSDCGVMEPHRAECTRCHKFVNLGRKQTYAVRPWETHRSRCDEKQPQMEGEAEAEVDGDSEDGGGDGDDAASTVAPSVAPSEASVRRNESERKAVLESDSRAEVIKPEEVLCRKCHKWVKLSKKVRFALSNWNSHQRRCSGIVPSSRVAMAERKLRIVNDSQAKTFTARSVECALCSTNITLEGDGEYNLTKWDEHKSAGCSRSPTSNRSPGSIHPINLSPEPITPSSPSVPPPSSRSTDGTLIASDGSPLTPKCQGTKRAREDEDDVEDPEARPYNRPRTETYEPPQKEAPGPLGWFLLPFKAFVRGFQESLGTVPRA